MVKMNRAEIFRQVFGIYAEEFWAKSEQEMLEWITEKNEFKNLKGEFKASNKYSCLVNDDKEKIAKIIQRTKTYNLTPPKDMINVIDTRTTWWYECELCNQTVEPTWRYCPHCGSKLKWSEIIEK
jgi:rRNA maturation endonuclease Nob1